MCNIQENASATIYGYTDSTRVLGMNFKSMTPGLGFIFGRQPDTNFVNMMASNRMAHRRFQFQLSEPARLPAKVEHNGYA